MQACLDAAAVEIDHYIDAVHGHADAGRLALANRVNVLRGVEWFKSQRRRVRRDRVRRDRRAAGPAGHVRPARPGVGAVEADSGGSRERRQRRPTAGRGAGACCGRARTHPRRPDPDVLVDYVDAVHPPALILLWDDPWLEPRPGTHVRPRLLWNARLLVWCIAGRVEPGPGVAKLEELVGYAIGRLRRRHLPVADGVVSGAAGVHDQQRARSWAHESATASK